MHREFLSSRETLLSPELLTTSMLNNLQTCAKENFTKEKRIQDTTDEIEAVNRSMKKELYLLKKYLKDKHVD